MVKVREDQPLNSDGSVNLVGWLKRLQDDVKLARPEHILSACELAAELEAKAASSNENIWIASGSSSLRTGLEMADILGELQMDEDTLIAAILYRAVREKQIALPAVSEQFGETVAKLIQGVIDMAAISQIQMPADGVVFGQNKSQLENLRKMLVTMIDDVRVALIKLAERTCAIREVKRAPREKRLRVAREVFEIYAPLAHRLGIGYIKWELEDLSFRYLEEEQYKNIARLLSEKRLDRTEYIEKVIALLKEKLKADGIEAQVHGRAKHIYSIWRKMKRKNIDFSEVYDVRAVRIMVPDVKSCYAALGIIHGLWHHIPNEFDDYIATPKENGYRSLHTAVVGPEGKVLEVQIRTGDMHEEAELGVCAHWLYKGTDTKKSSDSYEEKIAWLRQVLEWHEEVGDATGLREELRNDVAPDRIYIFTPDGHVVDLPHDATPVDFAYRVHTEVGHRCRGAKVNGRIVPLTYHLKTGDQVEILTSENTRPSRDWLNPALGYALTSRTRAKIQSWFKLQDRDQNMVEGKQLLEKEFKQLGLNGLDIKKLAKAVNYTTDEDMYAALGAGDLRIGQVLSVAQNLFGETDDEEQLEKFLMQRRFHASGKNSDDITIHGVGNLMTQIAKCCHPVPGDSIVGYITVGRGVSIHREDCSNALQLTAEDPHRMINVEWGEKTEHMYSVDIRIRAWDRSGLLRDITSVLANEKVNVLSVNTLTDKKENQANILITLEVTGLQVLGRVLNRIEQLPNILDVQRFSEKNK
ncbi:GTP pyrophosphokinase [Oceanospirillum multiglobuliferum]|uniref:GTP pyrophosphokinase n=2 Tax=Oceanospirillum TaxID=965 RepID=A0A1T4Q345_9GAMM|nr:GTP diphosphokinase [Oceanospirillum multiglobuliferum]OPX55499.1 GTP diphosphokinase [Oceanospirillum multiglobuliferum]SJZ98210.1 GTP pyrophosphokinase [Oceanospirillum multiglobuliferum]